MTQLKFTHYFIFAHRGNHGKLIRYQSNVVSRDIHSLKIFRCLLLYLRQHCIHSILLLIKNIVFTGTPLALLPHQYTFSILISPRLHNYLVCHIPESAFHRAHLVGPQTKCLRIDLPLLPRCYQCQVTRCPVSRSRLLIPD